MLKPVLVLFFCNVMITYQQPLGLPPLPTPVQKYNTPMNSSPTTYSLSYSWYPVQSNAANPVLGYKVKVWIPKKTKTVKIVKVALGLTVLEEYKEIDYNNLDKVDYDPIITIDVVGADSSTARIDGLKVDVTYLFRVQAYSAAGDGPLSSPFTLKLGPSVIVTRT